MKGEQLHGSNREKKKKPTKREKAKKKKNYLKMHELGFDFQKKKTAEQCRGMESRP